MLYRFLPLGLLVVLVSCGTPQEQCIRNASVEARRLDRLIAQSQANLARGYAYEEKQVVNFAWVTCVGGGGTTGQTSMCLEPFNDTVRREVAIDPAVETRKLENLVAKRKAIGAHAEAAVLACKQQHPEG